MKYYKKIENILNRNNGIITSAEFDENEIPRIYLSRGMKRGQLERVSRGIYISNEGDYDEYYFLYLQNNRIVYSFQSALYFHKLTDRIPYQREVTLPSSYNATHLPDEVLVHKADEKYFEVGLDTVKTIFGNTVPCYNKERTIVDIIKARNDMDPEVFVKALHLYQRSKDKDPNRLMQYAKTFKVEKKVFAIMELIENE